MVGPSLFKLRWNNSSTYLTQSLAAQYSQGSSHLDLTLTANGGSIGVHRNVLCACSSLLNNLFLSLDDEDREGSLSFIIPSVTLVSLRSAVEFIYTGSTAVASENISDLWNTANLLQIHGLLDILKDKDIFENIDSPVEEVDVEKSLHTVLWKLISNSKITIVSPIVETITLEETEQDTDDLVQGLDNEATFIGIPAMNEVSLLKPLATESAVIMDEDKPKSSTDKKFTRKDYSDDDINTALEKIRDGMSVDDVSAEHSIPRATLYSKAKHAGIVARVPCKPYTDDHVAGAIEAVSLGKSIAAAAKEFDIPKTVLWRRVKRAAKAGVAESLQRFAEKKGKAYTEEALRQATQALERGVPLQKVARQYDIPSTTLFREKTKLVQLGKVPASMTPKLVKKDRYSQDQMQQALRAIVEGEMSSSGASSAYGIPKSTLWRHLHKISFQEFEAPAAVVVDESNLGEQEFAEEIVVYAVEEVDKL